MVTKIDVKDQNSEKDADDGSTKNEKEGLPKGVYLIAQEIKMVKSLVSHDPVQRSKQLKKLSKWLKIRSNSSFPFNEDDFLRLWKGLYFSMWMCDKPLNQENLADDLGNLLMCFNDTEISIQFFGAFLKTMGLEWYGIDQWRMDKFMMLIRRMFRKIFEVIKKNNWQSDCIDSFNSHISSTLSSKISTGLAMHIMDVYLEELAKISNGNISAGAVAKFLQPFITYLASQKELKLLGYIRNRIFYHLLWQSELGREYTDKYNAWKEMGFPTETIDDIEKLEENMESQDETQENQEEITLDPRAGNVDVFIPALPVDATEIIKRLEKIQYTEITNTKSRRFIKTILEKYKTFENGNFPLGIKKIPKLNLEPFESVVDKKVNELKKLEDTLYGTTRKLKKLNKKKRRKLLSSLNFEELNEDTFEDIIENSISRDIKRKSSNDEWVEEEIKVPRLSQPETEQNMGDISRIKEKNRTNDWIEDESLISEKSRQTETVKSQENNKLVKKKRQETESEWDQPLKEGEIEYFTPSKRIKLKDANDSLNSNIENVENTSNLVLNPFSKKENKINKQIIFGKNVKKVSSTNVQNNNMEDVKSYHKKVKIVLQKNTIQKPSDYIRQVKCSPTVPYDAEKMPTKSLLKPNLTPSPINPFYKNKIGLKLN